MPTGRPPGRAAAAAYVVDVAEREPVPTPRNNDTQMAVFNRRFSTVTDRFSGSWCRFLESWGPDGENGEKTGKNGGKMGEKWPKESGSNDGLTANAP